MFVYICKFQARHNSRSTNRRLGTQVPLFYPTLVGFFNVGLRRDQEQDRVAPFWTHGPLYKMYIFTHDQPVASFYPSNPKSQSHCLLSLCIILLVLAYFYAF